MKSRAGDTSVNGRRAWGPEGRRVARPRRETQGACAPRALRGTRLTRRVRSSPRAWLGAVSRETLSRPQTAIRGAAGGSADASTRTAHLRKSCCVWPFAPRKRAFPVLSAPPWRWWEEATPGRSSRPRRFVRTPRQEPRRHAACSEAGGGGARPPPSSAFPPGRRGARATGQPPRATSAPLARRRREPPCGFAAWRAAGGGVPRS